MKTSLYIAVLLMAIASCKTTKRHTNVKLDERVTVTSNKEVQADSSSTTSINEVVEMWLEEKDSVVMHETVVELSQPDTAGKQYPVKVTQREVSKVSENKSRTHNARDSTYQVDTGMNVLEKADLKTETSGTLEETVKIKARTPWVVYVIVAIIFILVILILKRFGLIKLPGR